MLMVAIACAASSIMTVTPAAVEEPFNVGAGILVSVPAICGCSKVSVRNIGTDPVEVLNSNIAIIRTNTLSALLIMMLSVGLCSAAHPDNHGTTAVPIKA